MLSFALLPSKRHTLQAKREEMGEYYGHGNQYCQLPAVSAALSA